MPRFHRLKRLCLIMLAATAPGAVLAQSPELSYSLGLYSRGIDLDGPPTPTFGLSAMARLDFGDVNLEGKLSIDASSSQFSTVVLAANYRVQPNLQIGVYLQDYDDLGKLFSTDGTTYGVKAQYQAGPWSVAGSGSISFSDSGILGTNTFYQTRLIAAYAVSPKLALGLEIDNSNIVATGAFVSYVDTEYSIFAEYSLADNLMLSGGIVRDTYWNTTDLNLALRWQFGNGTRDFSIFETTDPF